MRGVRVSRILLMIFLTLLAGIGIAAALMHGRRVRTERRLAQVNSDWRRIASACAAYGVDNCGRNFPADTSVRRQIDPSAPQTFEDDREFMRQTLGNMGPCLLTTPVAYLKTIPRDPFHPDGGYYGYGAIRAGNKPGSINTFAFLHSPGPDGRTDLDPGRLRAQLDQFQQNRKDWFLANRDRVMIRRWIDPSLYDPTNGARSGGDLVLFMDGHSSFYGFALNSKDIWGGKLDELMYAGDGDQLNPPLEEPLGRELIPEDQRDLKIPVPVALMADLERSGVVSIDGNRVTLNHERLDQVRGHLGQYAGFFDTARPLNIFEKESLAKWRSEDPAWWGIIDDKILHASGSVKTMSVYEFYPVLALYGKSRLLAAAALLDTGGAARVLMETDKLLTLLSEIRAGWGGASGTPYMERVHGELGRLCSGLDQSMERYR